MADQPKPIYRDAEKQMRRFRVTTAALTGAAITGDVLTAHPLSNSKQKRGATL
jgi:hypothetical protein